MPNTRYNTDLTDAAWAIIAPLLPPVRPGGRPRSTDIRAVVNAVFYLLRTGCQWRLLPREFPAWGTVYYYFRTWENQGVWTRSATSHLRGRAPGSRTVPLSLGRNRRFSKDYEYRVQTSETLLEIAAIRIMLNRLVPA